MVGHAVDNDVCRHKHKVALARRVGRIDVAQRGNVQRRTVLIVVITIADVIDNGGVVIGKGNVLNKDLAIQGPGGHVGFCCHSKQQADGRE